MINIFHRSREFVEKHKQHHHIVLAVLALVIAGTGVYTYRHEIVQAATFTFNQSSSSLGGGGWTGLDTATPLATHTSNQTNWSKYSAKSTYISADANGISLPSSAKPITDDGAGLSALSPATISFNGTVPPFDITTSPDGTFVYATGYTNGYTPIIAQYSRAATTGLLTALSPATIPTGTDPYGITISPDGTSVYVTSYTSGTVYQYSRAATTGLLTALSPATIPTGTAPRGITISPDGTSVYVTNYTSGTVSQYSRAATTGLLTALSPATIPTGTGSYDITISPDGTSVYVTNYTSGTVSQYSRAATTGLLTALSPATIPTGTNPRGITISPDGTSVYVINYTSGTVSQYSRAATTGLLTALSQATISTGPYPRGITSSPDGTSVYVTNWIPSVVYMYSRGARGGATGFEYGANSNTAVSGSGPSASVTLGDTSTGGTKTTSGAYTIRTFTGSGTFTPAFSGNLEALVVGGGGGGGNDVNTVSIGAGGGGGGGGVVNNPTFAVTAQQAYTVTVGSGGSNVPASGANSVFGSIITATGGGRGGYCPASSCTGTTKAGAVGGSGGGGLGSANAGYAEGAGTAGQGNAGGAGFLDATNGSGGGGGGAGGPGATSTSGIGGNGGNGLPYSTSGASVTYGGGGGGAVISGTSGTGGTGGGGNAPSGSGTANTGGGGGAGVASAGGAGGSGIVVVKYLSPLSGTFMSSVIDTGAKSNFTTLAYTTTLNGQTLTVDIRAGDSATAPTWGSTDANWTSTGITNVANGGSISSLGAHRYVQYRANLSTNDWSISPTLDNVVINSTQYSLGGDLTSSVFDTIDSTNILAGISWTAGSTSGTETVEFRIRSSADNSIWTNWCGATLCNNTDTFTTSPATISSSHPIRTDGVADRYVQYKVILVSGGSVTPSVTQVVVTYVVNASPLVGNIVASQISDSASANYGKVSFSFDASDSDTTTGSPANQLKLTPTLYEYSTDGGSTWPDITSGLSANAYDVIALTGDHLPPGSLATTTTAVTWTPTSGLYANNNAKIRVTVTDSEAANATAVGAMAGTFTLDSTAPVVSTANLNSSGVQDVVNLTASDSSTLEYRLCNTTCSSETWTAITSGVATPINWTATGAPNAETVYLQVRDLYGNVNTSPTSVVAPAMPTSLIVADVSNPAADSFGETLSWVADPSFTTGWSYDVDYATSVTEGGPAGTYSWKASPTTNIYPHSITTATTSAYWYRVRAVNANGDKSNFVTVTGGDIPNGFGTTLPDATAPTIVSFSVPTIKNTSANIIFETNELAIAQVYYGAGTLVGSCTTATTPTTTYSTSTSVYLTGLTSLTDYAYCFKVTDVLGNPSAILYGGTFRTVGGPVITNVTEREITDTSALIFWNTSTSSTSWVKYATSATANAIANGTSVGSDTMVSESPTPGVFQHQVGLGIGTPLVAGQTYYFQVTSTNSDGTTTDTNNGQYYKFVTLLDTSPPTITGTSTPVLASNAAVVVWQTSEPADGQLFYDTSDHGTDTSLYPKYTQSQTPATSVKSIFHVMTLSSDYTNYGSGGGDRGLVKETPYYYVVKSSDTAGNTALSAGTFTTPSDGNVTITVVAVSVAAPAGVTPDTTAPAVSNVKISDITPFSAVVKFDTDEDADGFVEYGKDVKYGDTAGDKTFAKTHTIKLRGLTLGTDYHIKVTAHDKAGNTGTSADQTFKTTFLSENLKDMANVENIEQFQKEIESAIESILPSLVPPFVAKPVISDITESGVTVSFKTNIKAFPVVVFAEDGAYDETKENPYTGEVSDTAEKATTHSLKLTGLKGNTKYHVQARGFSLPKVIGKSADVTFITKASKIAGSIVERKKDSFTVVWTTEQPTTSIVEYKDLKRGITGRKTDDSKKKSHSMKIENLPPGTAYEVNLSGMTEQGNVAEAGSPLSVTTSTDTTPPTISGFKVDNALVPGRTDRIQTIVSWVTDEPSNSTAYYEEGAGTPGDTEELASKNEILDSYVTNHSVILPSLKPGTIYRLKVTSSDDSGNLGSFGPRTVITPKQTESITDIIFKNFEDSFKFLQKI